MTRPDHLCDLDRYTLWLWLVEPTARLADAAVWWTGIYAPSGAQVFTRTFAEPIGYARAMDGAREWLRRMAIEAYRGKEGGYDDE